MIVGKAVFVCPRTSQEVTLHKDCVDCQRFEHWGTKGHRPYVHCKPQENENAK